MTDQTSTEGYPVKKFDGATRRIVQTLSLRDNPALIADYRRLHSKEHIWPEILKGIREVGILEMEIYIRGTLLVMVMEVDATFDWSGSMSRLATLPRQDEWERVVAEYQKALPGQASAEKWKMMERMFYLYDRT